jgi:hypothetical protein
MVPNQWLLEQIEKGNIRSGLIMKMPKNTFFNEERAEINMMDLPEMASTPVGPEGPQRRELAVVEGKLTILVVRVVARDSETTRSEEDLANSVFGTNGQAVNMKSQYDSCSHGKLNFERADSRDSYYYSNSNRKIRNGVTTVYVDISTGQGDSVMRNAVTAKLNQEFDVSKPNQLADLVMYCLPPGTFSGVAYAYIDSWNSIYNDEWCSKLSAQMHEVGHNLNLGHRYVQSENDFFCPYTIAFLLM